MGKNTSARSHPSSGFGESQGIIMTLLDGPLTKKEIAEQFQGFVRRFGFFGDLGRSTGHRKETMEEWLESRLEKLLQSGKISRQNEHYELTPSGRAEAEKTYGELHKVRERFDRAARPENAATLTVIVHFILAAVKVPAALLSGSVGLLNDGVDTVVDGASSLLVYFGIRADKEAAVSRILVGLMFATGIYTLIEAVLRIIRREPVDADAFAFTAVLISALVCGILWLIQRFIGLKHNSMALIAQSVDSRNHILVAGGVGTGLIAAALHFPWIDYAVGLIVAVLILKSAAELWLELLRRGRTEEDTADSRYGFRFMERLRSRQLCGYMLHLVRSGAAEEREELLRVIDASLDFGNNLLLRSIDYEEHQLPISRMEDCYDNLLRDGLISFNHQGKLEVSRKGMKQLSVNRWFDSGQDRNSLGRQLLKGLGFLTAVAIRLAVMLGLYYLTRRYLLPRLPDLGLWHSLRTDGAAITAAGLSFTAAHLIHLGLGIILSAVSAAYFRLLHPETRAIRRGNRHAEVVPVETGLYARVRHPMYGARILSWLGLCTALASAWGLIAFAALSGGQMISAVLEERRELIAKLGDRYRGYRGRVPAWFFTPLQRFLIAASCIFLAAGLVF